MKKIWSIKEDNLILSGKYTITQLSDMIGVAQSTISRRKLMLFEPEKYEVYKEKERIKRKEYNNKNKEKRKEYYDNNRERIIEYVRVYQRKNKEKVNEANRKSRAKQGEVGRQKRREYMRNYRKNNINNVNDYEKQYAKMRVKTLRQAREVLRINQNLYEQLIQITNENKKLRNEIDNLIFSNEQYKLICENYKSIYGKLPIL